MCIYIYLYVCTPLYINATVTTQILERGGIATLHCHDHHQQVSLHHHHHLSYRNYQSFIYYKLKVIHAKESCLVDAIVTSPLRHGMQYVVSKSRLVRPVADSDGEERRLSFRYKRLGLAMNYGCYFFFESLYNLELTPASLRHYRYIMIAHHGVYSAIYRPVWIVLMIAFCWLFPLAMLLPTLLGRWGEW